MDSASDAVMGHVAMFAPDRCSGPPSLPGQRKGQDDHALVCRARLGTPHQCARLQELHWDPLPDPGPAGTRLSGHPSVHVLPSPPPEPAGRVPGSPGSGGRRRQAAGQPPIRTSGAELPWNEGARLWK
ncbi:unnamed protein product [Rangifer tarandus platyrhynchus]|uniref:Uncharacterized protein n=1 Tax=Rangifer tarandus platyrhynchus TaxID=3082113 RepID=A0AC59YQX6_RANTA